MKRFLALLIIVIPVLLSGLFDFSDMGIFPKTGTAGLQFLKLGVDARAIGMGEAYTALATDISSVYWNPGGLAVEEYDQVFFSHTNWPADIMHEFVAASHLTDYGVFGLHISYLHMDDMDITTEEQFGPTGEQFTCYDLAIGATYSQLFTDRFSFGLSAKYVREQLYEYDVNGLAIDLGSLYNTGYKNITIGMALRNFGPNLKYEIDEDGDGSYDEDPFDLLDNDGDGLFDEDRQELPFKIPMQFSFGISGDIFRNDTQHLIGAFQIDNCVDRKETFNVGLEYRILVMFLRMGYQMQYDTNSFTAGCGFKVSTRYGIFHVDWAYTDMGYLEETFMKGAHRLSLKVMY